MQNPDQRMHLCLTNLARTKPFVFKPFVLPPCVGSLTLSFVLMAPSSQSKARRQRANAVKWRLWHKTLPEQSFPKQVPVQQCGDLSVLMVQQILRMNGIILQWLVAGSSLTHALPLYTDGTICGRVPAEDGSGMFVGSGGGDPVANVGETFWAEPGPLQADVATESFSGEHGDAAVEDRLAEVVANVWCNGRWKELPVFVAVIPYVCVGSALESVRRAEMEREVHWMSRLM